MVLLGLQRALSQELWVCFSNQELVSHSARLALLILKTEHRFHSLMLPQRCSVSSATPSSVHTRASAP